MLCNFLNVKTDVYHAPYDNRRQAHVRGNEYMREPGQNVAASMVGLLN